MGITDGLCARIEAGDAALGAFVRGAEADGARRERLGAGERAVREQAGRERAVRERAVRERVGSPGGGLPLFCVPVAVKDVLRVDGLPTRAGSALPAGVFAGPQAAAVDRLRDAGALVAGKAVTAEFAMSAPGPTRNPHHPEHTPGGSSSGSAAAVGAGLVPLALGTQTIGSVIRPAAYCGVVGFKPTSGRIPLDGVVPYAPSLDAVGLLADGLPLAAAAAAVLCDGWRTPDPLPAPVLGVPDGPFLRRAEPESLAAFAAQVRALAEAGFTVRRVPFPDDFDEVTAALWTVTRYEAARSHAAWFPRYGHLYRPQSAALVRQGLPLTGAEHARALRRRAEFRERLAGRTADAGVDLWITPSATGPAPRGLDATGDPTPCVPWSWAGWPALSLPAGRSRGGLPLGLQCAAPARCDERLLAWAGPVAAALAGRSGQADGGWAPPW
ncbi:amidase [Kitasatospora phosalacinea]|uniref:Amidase n=1 Tax=Kitasatospora phosalacinea TaxID=2065 RepID=A0A9W6PIP8_9ACTN|nr:amidase [Kitasatospora phosalacinea]GLW55654.1 amidase [Kitasatospora phosalacinea]